MLPVSLDCPFLIAPSVSSAQCCLCLCLLIVHSWVPFLCLVPNVACVSGLSILIAPSVSSAQCCPCLWIFHSWVPLLCLVPNVACDSGLSILDCPFCVWCPMLHMSLDCLFLIVPFVSSAQYWLCLWTFHSWLALLCLVPNVACVSGLSIRDFPSVSSAQCCLCLWIVHSWLPLLCLVPNIVCVSGLSILGCPFCVWFPIFRRGNQEWTIQRHRQHWALNTEGAIKNGQSRDTVNIGH
jgi:hypothetical protein